MLILGTLPPDLHFMPGDVELFEAHDDEENHKFSVSARKVMKALIIGLTISLLMTAFSYTYFKSENQKLRNIIDRRVPSEDGITIEIEDAGLVYFCVDDGADGSFVCNTK